MNILILHGWNLSGAKYTKLAKLLEKSGNRVYVPDLPGFGTSELPEKPYSVADYARYVRAYIAQNTLKKAVIIGHSFGGRVAIKLVSENPELVSQLVLTGVPGVRSTASLKRSLYYIAAKVGKYTVSLPWFRNLSGTARKLLYRAAQESDYHRAHGVMRETFKLVVNEKLTNEMKKVTVSTHLIWGSDDTITPLSTARKMVRLIRGSRLTVIPDAGHSVIYKKPNRFIKFLHLYSRS